MKCNRTARLYPLKTTSNTSNQEFLPLNITFCIIHITHALLYCFIPYLSLKSKFSPIFFHTYRSYLYSQPIVYGVYCTVQYKFFSPLYLVLKFTFFMSSLPTYFPQQGFGAAWSHLELELELSLWPGSSFNFSFIMHANCMGHNLF